MGNLDKLLDQCTKQDWKRAGWYQDANLYLVQMSEHLQVPIEKVTGVCAALSPSCLWKQNVVDTYQFIKRNGKGYVPTTYPRQVDKARRILRLARKHLGRIPVILNGPKTVAFYRALLDPNGKTEPVVDTHMIKAFLGDPEIDKSNKLVKRYLKPNRMVEVQREIEALAEEYRLNVHGMQAVLWSVWKRVTDNRVDSNTLPIWNSMVNQPAMQQNLFQ